jgi:hypothetical protein
MKLNNEKKEIEILTLALLNACRILKKAGVVYGKVDGKPIRLSKDEWLKQLVKDAKAELGEE